MKAKSRLQEALCDSWPALILMSAFVTLGVILPGTFTGLFCMMSFWVMQAYGQIHHRKKWFWFSAFMASFLFLATLGSFVSKP